MKDLVIRHPLMVGGSIAGIIWILAFVLGSYSRFYYLLGIPAVVIYAGAFVFIEKWLWVCTKCGEKALSVRHKYCPQCGGVMGLIKKEKMRFCPNGCYVEKWDKFCPKCSAPLREKSN